MNQRSPRAERADGVRARETILSAAARMATVEGLEGLSIGSLAEHIGMSKSGLYAHFGSKEELQLATIDKAWAIFSDVVVDPALTVQEPVARLEALCDLFLQHLRDRVFPGGCFFSSAGAELAARKGPVRARVAQVQGAWMQLLIEALAEASAAGRLKPHEDPFQVAFELQAFLLMGNFSFLMSEDAEMLRRADVAFKTRLTRASA